MSSGRSLALVHARHLADHLLTLLTPVCNRIEIAGSIRRSAKEVHDIELVATPKLEQHAGQLDLFGGATSPKTVSLLDRKLDDLLDGKFIVKRPHLSNADFVTAWGEKYKKFLVARDGGAVTGLSALVQVDLYLTTAPQWGSIFVIRTGPAEFGHALVTYIKYKTWYRQQVGTLIDSRTGEVVPTPEERDYFQTVGLRYVPPEKRNQHTILPELPLWKRSAVPVPVKSSEQTPLYNSVATAAGEQVSDHTAGTVREGGIVYTDDISVRAEIRKRLEAVLDV